MTEVSAILLGLATLVGALLLVVGRSMSIASQADYQRTVARIGRFSEYNHGR